MKEIPSVAQTTTIAPNKEFLDPKTIVPSTPDVAGLFKIKESTVDYASGTVNTSIPLFTAVSGRIKVPVSLNYASNGVKVQDVASSIGLGWNLSYGYSLSVTEEEPKQFAYASKVYKGEFEALAATNLNETWMQEMKRSADGYYPTFFPVYRYNCGAYSGMFYFDQHNNNNVVRLGSRESKDIKVERQVSGNVILSFIVTTPDGLQYIFDKKETSLRVAQQNALGPVTTSFLCTMVRDVLNGDAIYFEYTAVPTYTIYNESSRIHYVDQASPSGSNPAAWRPDDKINFTTRMDVSSWVISKIDFKDGYARFGISNDRLDINPTRITNVSVYSKIAPGVLCKKVDFLQTYFQTSGGSAQQYNYRLKLDKVTFHAIEAQTPIPTEVYNFSYNEQLFAPYRLTANSREQNANGIDYWGFSNGGSWSGSSFLPLDICSQFAIPSPYNNYGVDRKANPSYTQTGILKSIKYPSGGVVSFEYENHQYSGYYFGNILGGLRIKNIKYFEGENQSLPAFEKTYNYIETIPLGFAYASTFSYLEPKGYVYDPTGYQTFTIYPYGVRTITSEPVYDFAYHNGSPLFYKRVEEYSGTLDNNVGKTIYTSYYTPPYYAPNDFIDMGKQKLFAENFGRGQLEKREIYKATGNTANPYEKIAQEVNTYLGGGASSTSLPSNGMVGFAVRKYSNTSQANQSGYWDLVGSEADGWYSTKSANHQMPIDAFVYNNFYLVGYEPTLTKREESQFANGQEIKTVTDFFYQSPFHSRMTSAIITDSKGQSRKREFKYVQDRTLITDQSVSESSNAFDAFFTVNKFNDIIEEKQSVNGTITTKMRDHYVSRWNANLELNIPVISAQDKTTYVNSNFSISKVFVDGYNDALKILGLYKDKAPVKAFLYDDNNSNLVAEVTNASKSDIRYTSFEFGAAGGWNFQNAKTYDSQAVSGSYVYPLSSANTLIANNLDNTQSYQVSYWSKNGPYAVNQTAPIKSISTASGWNYYVHKISGASIIGIIGSGMIDEVRLYPSESQMISYTYDSLLKGITTKTDEKDQITYYEYDGYQRLVAIKDFNKNIIKSFQYHYR